MSLTVFAGDKFCKSKTCSSKDIVENAVNSGKFNTLVTAVKSAGLVDTLKSKGPFTVLAPSDSAFDKLPKGTVETLLKDKDALSKILTYHVISGDVKAKKVTTLKSAKTVNGKDVTIKLEDGKVFINDAQVVMTDIECSNGTIHMIDKVLLPN